MTLRITLLVEGRKGKSLWLEEVMEKSEALGNLNGNCMGLSTKKKVPELSSWKKRE